MLKFYNYDISRVGGWCGDKLLLSVAEKGMKKKIGKIVILHPIGNGHSCTHLYSIIGHIEHI